MKKVVLITGIGKRLGLALANHLLAQGYQIIGTYRSEYPAITTLKERGVDLYPVDFYQQEQLENFIEQIVSQYDCLRAIIHNASDWLPDAHIKGNAQYSADEVMLKMMTIHASVPYQINLACEPLLKNTATEFADVIHISDYVTEKGSKKHIAYAASKTAMHSLTMSFSALFAPEVKVNTLSPALIKFNDDDDQKYKEKAFTKALIPKEAGFNEIIQAVDFIFTSQYITGRNIQIDGGRHLK
ncbi:MAG: dihydromonapterin reductase [Litorilituus sp.]|nr:dihydromonapterin reductase [Litorilituus sp.]